MSERIAPLTITRAGLIGSIVVLAVAAVCVRLGVWQISRLHQRDARNQLISERMALPPLRMLPPFGDTVGLLYRQVMVSGRYDHDRTIVLPGRSLRGVPGVHVLTPVVSSGGRSAVLVNRGWQPSIDGFTVQLDSLRDPTTVSLTGLVLPFPGAGRTRAADSTSDSVFRRAWFSPDPEAIRKQFPYSLREVQVQALAGPDLPKRPIPLPPPALDRGPHLGYAIQWFSFAAIAIGGWVALLLKKGELRRGVILPETEAGES